MNNSLEDTLFLQEDSWESLAFQTEWDKTENKKNPKNIRKKDNANNFNNAVKAQERDSVEFIKAEEGVMGLERAPKVTHRTPASYHISWHSQYALQGIRSSKIHGRDPMVA